jgi:hypothetical protein
MLRIPHCVANRLTVGGEVDSSTGRFLLHRNISVSGTDFCYMRVTPQGAVREGGFSKLIKLNYLVSRTRDLPACSIMLHPPS